ncbi:hypothetical protein BR93DRAFT_887083 [Coniochaeta sp. PMI_546]|nr:hypothetical protein BR93DRAFT_887083 [Coniochaeta sp. PMI_546]
MEESNGSLKASKAKGKANGVNGHLNGKSHLNGHINGHAVVPRRRTPQQGPGFVARGFSIIARLLTWYSIFTLLLRCPSTLEACDENSPRICKPYFQVKHAVTPHIEPYYDAYAAPYVDLVKPFYVTLDRTVISPGWSYAAKHGAPQLLKARTYSQVQWEKNVHPQLLKYQSLVKSKYDESLAPHVNTVSTALAPYYDIAKTNALQTYHELLLPSYNYLQPHAQTGYRVASSFVRDTAVPSAVWAWNKTYFVLDGVVWPQIRSLYVENVEPQLHKIGQRLGRYNGQSSAPKPLAENLTRYVVSSFTKPTPSVASTVASASVSSSSTIASGTASDAQEADQAQSTTEASRKSNDHVQAPEWEQGEQEDEIRRVARETVAADLKDWQERYTKAADEGASEIEDRVDEISKRMIRRNARTTGKALLEQLQSTVVSELVTLRRDIQNIVGAVSKGNAKPEEAQEQITSVVRRAGMAIKEKAQEVREWRENYEAELHGAVTTAADNHFRILDSIRDLAIQKIGMKWAWMDGITYRDWQKYHLLKDRFDEWHSDLEKLIVSHPALEAAQLEGATIEEEAMNVAQSAAKELARLKQVASWKLAAADATEEFDSDLMKQAADAVESAKAAATSVADGVVDKVEDVAESVADAISEAAPVFKPSHAVENAGLSSATEALASEVSEGVSTATEAASKGFESVSSATETAASSASENISSATEAASSIAAQVFEPVVSVVSGTESAVPESEEDPSQTKPDLASAATEILLTETPVFSGNTTELEEEGPAPVEIPIDGVELEEPVILASSEEESLHSTATPSVKSAMFGAAAQAVPSRQIILDDDTYESVASGMSELPSTVSAMAQSAYSAAVSQANAHYSQALSAVSVQIHGTPKPAHEQMLASVTSVYSNAMSSASSRLDAALKAASEQFAPAPTTNNFFPTAVPIPNVPSVEWAQIESIASERLAQGRAWAEEQYESAKVRIGLATPTPSTAPEHVQKLLENARHNYYAGLGVAYARYSEFLAAASSAVSSITATSTPTDFAGTVSSLASVASESAASVASAAGENVSEAALAASASAVSAASAASASAASVASVASASAASAASVVGENVSSVAAAGYDAASAGYDSAASVAASAASVVGENVSSAAAAGYEAASAGYENIASAAGAAGDAVAQNWDNVISQLSVRVYGAPTPTPWYESMYSVLGDYAAAATDGAASVTSTAGVYAASASGQASQQYHVVSSIISELVVGKEPTFSESVFSRLNAAYSTGIASAASLASAAQDGAASGLSGASEAVQSVGERVASVASEATEAAKHARDEL